MDETEFQPERPLPSHKRRLPYVPPVVAAEPIRFFRSETHSALLLDDIQTAGMMRYRYLLNVFEKEPEDSSLIVACELFAGGPDYAVGLFTEEGHQTLGPTNQDWADEEKFCARALHLITERLGIALVEVNHRRPWWKLW